MKNDVGSNKIGRIVMQSKCDVNRIGVITFQRKKEDNWVYYTIFWITKTNGQAEWMKQIEWRCDAVKIIDENIYLDDLQSAIRFRNSRKFKEEVQGL